MLYLVQYKLSTCNGHGFAYLSDLHFYNLPAGGSKTLQKWLSGFLFTPNKQTEKTTVLCWIFPHKFLKKERKHN